jgi:hypothetical protein
MIMLILETEVAKAVKHFWVTRRKQAQLQGRISGSKDQGNRSAVTGGAQLDGFIKLVKKILVENGLDDACIYTRQTTLPGYFRPTKDWDIVICSQGHLLAILEFKSQVGPSFGNNFNNRVEEALGSATDLWTAYREGAFKLSQRPWLGYLILLETANGSINPVHVEEPHFPVFDEFRNASYSQRYRLFCERLVRERLYDSACLIMSDMGTGLKGKYTELSGEIGFKALAASLVGVVSAFVKQSKM